MPLQARGLVYEVRGMRLVDGIDLEVASPGVTVVMGPNGAGKSLLLRLLHGLLVPTAGEVRWNGRVFDEAARRRQALVFQRPVLLRRSVLANLEFVLRLVPGAGRDEALQWLEHVGLAAMAERPARRLSGGEQQRLAMARALALRPEVLLMDEPTASLDPASVVAIETLVNEARDEGTKILFVTHDVGQARRLADDVVFLHRGRLAEHTPADAFFERAVSPEARDYLAGRLVL
ncbi:MAG: ATP-binding cassette domain-containing protein [Gammaproteobacteria bacterium]|nr:ATP-binding cassette domain-containing protein [Gammaproteobacteria bacterium]